MKGSTSVIERQKFVRASRLGKLVTLDKPDWLRVRCDDAAPRTIQGYVFEDFFFFCILDRKTKKKVYYRNRLMDGKLYHSENNLTRLGLNWHEMAIELSRDFTMRSYKDTAEYTRRLNAFKKSIV